MSPVSAIRTLARPFPKTVLDVGSRTGQVAEDFARHGCLVTAIDPRPMFAVRRDCVGYVTVETTTLENYCPKNPFDLVVSNAVSHLVSYRAAEYILRLKSLIVRDGLIYVSLLGDEDEWADKAGAKAVSFGEALRIIDDVGLRTLYTSVTWQHGTTYDGRSKYWNYFRFVLTPGIGDPAKLDPVLTGTTHETIKVLI